MKVSLLAPWGKGIPSRGTDERRVSRSERRVGTIHDVIISQDKHVMGLGVWFLAKLSSSMEFIPLSYKDGC